MWNGEGGDKMRGVSIEQSKGGWTQPEPRAKQSHALCPSPLLSSTFPMRNSKNLYTSDSDQDIGILFAAMHFVGAKNGTAKMSCESVR